MANVYEDHQYLYHYTNLGGLRSILESQTLWATHYKALSDFSEVEHMRGFLERSIYPIVNRVMRDHATQSLRYRLFLDRHGGLFAASQQAAHDTVNNLYRTTFDGPGRDIGPFAEPYVVSFCAHTKHDNYVKANGLLSMWRAYGDVGGFALVFDTKRLWDCLQSDYKTYSWTGFYLGEVVYDNEEDKFESAFGELTQAIEQFIRSHANDTADPGNMFPHFFNAVTRFKHRGFKEESEVRFVASPVSKRLAMAAEEISGKDENRRIKPISTREKDGHEVKYIVLNDGHDKRPLPIVRIILGPQRNQSELAKQVKALVRDRIDAVSSETPYLPPVR